MKCSRCGYESDGYTLNGNCSLCGFLGVTGTLSAETSSEVVPWESGSADQAPLHALAVTFRNSFFRNKLFFSKISGNPSLIPALIYGMALGSIGTCAALFWNRFPFLSFKMLFPDSGIISDFSNAVSPGSLIATPIILLAQLFFSTIYVHAMLFITRSSKKPFLVTFKTLCYAEGAMVFQILPLIGPLLGLMAWIYLTVSGIHTVHATSIKRTMLVLLLPLLLLTIAIAVTGAIVVLASVFSSGTSIDPFSLFRQR